MSLQLDRYLSARRNGRTMMTACVESGIGADEARLIEADIARDPSMLAAPTTSTTPAPAEPAQPQENDMGRAKKAESGQINGEVPKPDFDLAASIHRNDIAPANKEQKRAMKEASDGWKAVKKDAHVNVGGYRQAMKIADMEEAEQQAYLRALHGGLQQRGIVLHADLDDIAAGRTEDTNVIPIGGAAPEMDLATDEDDHLHEAAE